MEVYLDNAATTKPCEEAVAAAVTAMTQKYGNPSSLHRAGLEAQLLMDSARKTIADSIGADSGCIYFTSGATESNNLALRGASAAYGRKRKKIVISAVEHASVEETAADLETKGFEVARVSPREDGQFYAADFISACDENTCLISMMYVNNETGYILPVKEVFSAINRRMPDIVTHTDCVQAYMKLPVKVSALNADLVSHKRLYSLFSEKPFGMTLKNAGIFNIHIIKAAYAFYYPSCHHCIFVKGTLIGSDDFISVTVCCVTLPASSVTDSVVLTVYVI